MRNCIFKRKESLFFKNVNVKKKTKKDSGNVQD